MAFSIKRLFWITDEVDDAAPAASAAPSPSTAPSSSVVPVAARTSSAPEGRGDAVPLSDVLSGLRDVDGVVGSIAMTPGGQVLGWDLPRLFDSATVSSVAHRLAQLRATLIADGNDFAGGWLAFQDYRVHIGSVPTGLVAVLAEERCSSPAVAMAIKVVGRRIAGVR